MKNSPARQTTQAHCMIPARLLDYSIIMILWQAINQSQYIIISTLYVNNMGIISQDLLQSSRDHSLYATSQWETALQSTVLYCHACIWPSIRYHAMKAFKNCVFGLYLYRKVWYKSEKVYGMCSKWHYTTWGMAYEDWQFTLAGSSCLHLPNSLVG